MRKFNVNVNGKSYVVEVEETDGSAAPVSSSASAPVQAPVVPVSATAAGGSMVKAPMPGLVLKFSVENGATVKKGDKVIVLEAMKMENDIVASADGTITFLVKAGDNVVSGADLACIK
ncbi:MAG: acetyl-CoA carboxylase biotin carboxyl carrier protein subunit [Clostridia bacterium]|jgi:glutaconyl-CoA decarboxylase|nr:acetyl-CoA carboxylase biotin carboxyl carrier protein subunit [Clostridia bacterium]